MINRDTAVGVFVHKNTLDVIHTFIWRSNNRLCGSNAVKKPC